MIEDERQRRRFRERGHNLYAAGRLTEALVEFERALSLAPDDSDTLATIAAIHLDIGDLDRTRDYARRALEANPEQVDAFHVLTGRHLLLADLYGAYRHATQAVEIDARDVTSLYLLAHCALALERDEEAAIIGGILLESSPGTVQGFHVMAKVAKSRNDLPGAVSWLERVLELAPNDPDHLDDLAEVQSLLRRDHASADYLQAALNEDSHDSERQVSLRSALHRLALFGEPGKRWSSAGAKVSGAVAAALVLWFGLNLWIADDALRATNNRVVFFGLPAFALLGLVLLRKKYIERRHPGLAYAFAYVRRRAKRGTLIGLAVILVCIGGIVAILADEGVDPLWRYAPAWLPFAGVWIALVMLPIGLVRALLLDVYLRGRASSSEVAHAASAFNRRFLLLSCLLLTALSAVFLSGWFFMPALVLFIATAVAYFHRYPYRTAIATFLATQPLEYFYYFFPNVLDLTPSGAAVMLRFFSFVLLFLAVKNTVRRRWQRRRIGKLLGDRASGTSVPRSAED